MRGQGAKGSVKNRIYQFWLIQLFLKRKEKRKQQKLLKQKKLREEQKKLYQELMMEPVQKWKIIKKTPYIKKEGTMIQIYPLGKKPPVVVEIYEIRRTVGIAPKQELKKKNYKIEKKEVSKILKPKIENPSTKQNAKIETKPIIEQKKTKIEVVPKLEKKVSLVKNNFKKGAAVIALTGGTIIAFPALIQNFTSNKKKINLKKQEPKKTTILNGEVSKKTEKVMNQIQEKEVPKKNETNHNTKELLETKRPPRKFKLYRTKLEASKEAEILIESEIKKQQSYLKKLNERLQKLERTSKINYHFRGVFHIVKNLLKFSLGLFTIPFTKNRIFGTAIGLVLMNNGIRGLKNSFKSKENHDAYIEFQEIARAISNEKQALSKIEHLIVDSLDQILDLKQELEIQFYGKVSFKEYEDMKRKIESMEQKLLKKQKEMKDMQNHLEKNKVKVKKMENKKDHY